MTIITFPPKEEVEIEEEDNDVVYACACGCVLFYIKEDGNHCSTCGNIMFHE